MTLRTAFFWGAALTVLAAAAIMQVQSGNAGDKNWLLLAAKTMLRGKKLYVDIFEVDPPFIVWLFAVPQWLAMHGLPLADFQILALLGLLFCGISVALGVCLIRKHPEFAHSPAKQALFALLLASVFIFFTSQVYFFDRDHIFLVLTFPYLLRFMPACARAPLSLTLRITIAVLATVGFCIKPYTLIVFVVLQLIYILRERTIRIVYSLENIIIYAGGALYLLCVWVFAPEYVRVVMPMAWLTYSGFNRRINGFLFLAIASVSAGLTFIDFRPRASTPYRAEAYYFMQACLAYLLYALAGNGWGYTYNPLLCMLLFLSGWMLWDYGWLKRDALARGLPTRPFVSGQAGCIVTIALNTAYMALALAFFFTSPGCDKRAECSRNDAYADFIHAHQVRSFGTLSLNLRQWTSLVRRTGAQWDTRFNHFWMLPKLMQEGAPFRMRHQWITDYVGKGLADDMNARKPDVMFVDTNNGIFGYPHPVDMPAWLSGVAEFKGAWRNYRYLTTIDQCEKPEKPEKAAPVQIDCRYDIYGRVSFLRDGK